VHGVIGALFYMRSRSLRNAALSRLKRLRQPKYLVGGIVGIAYVYFVFFRRAQLNGSRSAANALPVELVPAIATVAVICLLVFVILCWVWRRDRAALNFSEAEIAFLFPAPITRSALIHYRLISVQMRVLVSAAIMALFSASWSFLPGNWPMRFIGWWLIFATLSLHVIGSSFVLTRMLDSGMSVLRRQLVVLGVITFTVALLVLWPSANLRAPTADELASFRDLMKYLLDLVDSGPLRWLLLPGRWLFGPLLAVDGPAFLAALGPALLVYAIHYLWVLRNEVAFEETSIEQAEKRAAKVSAMSAGNRRFAGAGRNARRAPFDLSKVRRPELAFLWKNLLSSREYLGARTALIAVGVILAGSTWLAGHPTYENIRETLAMFSLATAAYLLVLGPQFARQDLRSDLLNTDILKTYPLHGWQIVLGEILTPLAIVTALIWLLLLTAVLNFQPQRLAWLTFEVRWAIAMGLAAIAPLLCALQLLVVNAAAVLFPAWLQTSRGRAPPSIEVMGQRIFFVVGQFLVVVLALLPAAVTAALVYGLLQWLVNIPVAAVFAFVAAFAILGVEVGWALAWLGRLFERFDLSAELRP
jgi:ABC-2 type transport system permease protein